MSQATPATPHLCEDILPERANTERRIFAEWASSVPFKKQAEDFEIHDSDELGTKLNPLLETLNLPNKGYSLVQIPGPKVAKFRHSDGDAFIIPIEILENRPSASGRPLQEGNRLYMKAKHEVEIEPKLRLLFILL